ncbi:SIS domain-containing protein [Metabacillus litoralis]|uniref:KpsF/GutQ family sugar-phosphate isomerase n=1 Tax=Metabacillus litoralis TaxID=152268 RepID=UPI00203BA374|nr:KpsF/GutQ family sugar-phosphate isomerase [Metabacillus litoralis]MCM3652948.1 KpsF/GutQ family sugar-phosphate isomerase [Metabacillus litoralis]
MLEPKIKRGKSIIISRDAIEKTARSKSADYIPIVKRVLEKEGMAVLDQRNRIDHSVNKAINLMLNCKGRVVITGIGKSGIIARKMVATFSSTGTPALFLHPAEGVHGDLGMVMKDDVVIAISNSGESAEILHLFPTLTQIGVKMIGIVKNPDSSLGKRADIVLSIGTVEEAGKLGLAPTTSTTVTLALGDALALALTEARGFKSEDFALYHPSGTLGKKLLLTVGELIARRDKNPTITIGDKIKTALFIMTKHEIGAISVIDESNRFIGLLSDGDIRRAFTELNDVLDKNVEDLCNRNPVTIKYDNLASDVLILMKEKRVSVIPVLDDLDCPISMLQIQSLIELGL